MSFLVKRVRIQSRLSMNKILILFFLICSCCNETNKLKTLDLNEAYMVILSNAIGKRISYCNHYKREGNTYKLFNLDSNLIQEITITNGFLIDIRRNKQIV